MLLVIIPNRPVPLTFPNATIHQVLIPFDTEYRWLVMFAYLLQISPLASLLTMNYD